MVRKITPIPQTMPCSEYGDVSADYSIAIEYEGPPVDQSIPCAAPLDFHLIPTAQAAPPSSPSLCSFAVPVVQPIAGRSKKNPMKSNLGFGNGSFSGEGGAASLERDGGSRNRLDVIGGDDGMRYADLSSRNSEEIVRKSLGGTESSGNLGFFDSRSSSQELTGSSDMAETPLDCDAIQGLERYMDPAPQPFAVEVSSSSEEESDEEGLQRRARRANVTSVEPGSGEKIDGEGDEKEEEGGANFEVDSVPVGAEAVGVRRQVPDKVVKKGICFLCLKGLRFSEKEVCIVCDAKYCCNCVLIAMGSMPEGRKCLGCIGCPINESKRSSLGKCSRMLRGLLDKDEIKQIMHSELSCPVNHLLPVYVNGKPLSEEELNILQSCPVPPRRLKPGRYWYDKLSGFWGKEGHKPCQVISHNLEVGNPIRRDASNGDTNLLINGREITKRELWMLKSAGVQCAGISSLWLMPDGSYQEEGMNFVKGKKIWGRKRTKFLCSVLSLPTPEPPHLHREPSNSNTERVISTNLDHRPLYKILLVGNDQSGTCTIFKQARVRYNVPFSEEERQHMKYMIQRKLYGYLAVVLEGREYFEQECLAEMRRQAAEKPGPSNYMREEYEKNMYTLDPKLRLFSNWLLDVGVSGNLESTLPAAAGDYASNIELLLKDPAIQATCNRIDELGLPREAKYCLDKAVMIAETDYMPSDTDILYAEGISSSHGLEQVEFTFPDAPVDVSGNDSVEQPNPVCRCQLVRVQAKTLGEQCKWLEMFEDFSIVLFCVSLTDYDEDAIDTNGDSVNKMMESKRLFESVVMHPTFSNTTFLLILSKIDLLEKVEQIPLNKCEWFNDFTTVPSRHPSRSNPKDMSPLTQRAFYYVGLKFKRLFKSLTGRNLYVWPAKALEQDSVDGAMRYAREIMRWEEEKASLSFSFNGMYTEIMEASSS